MEPLLWKAIRISYYEENKDDLILHAARPLLQRLSGEVPRAYFLRHWRQGPHLLIPVEATASAIQSVVIPAAEQIIGRYLTGHPSCAPLSDDALLLKVHQRLAEMENEPRPLRPLAADNQIAFEDHDRRLTTVGGPSGAEMLADFYCATNELAWKMLERIHAGMSREAVALSLMLSVAHSYCGDPPNISSGFVSFRSHAEAYLHHCTDPSASRAEFDWRYRANRRALTRLAEKVLSTLDARTDQAEFVRDWVTALKTFWDRSAALAASRQLGPAPGDDHEDRSERGASPMHRMMYGSSAVRAQLFDTPIFQRYRLMLNYTYLHLARIGITALTRYMLCHLAANAVEDVLGLNAIALIESIARADASSQRL